MLQVGEMGQFKRLAFLHRQLGGVRGEVGNRGRNGAGLGMLTGESYKNVKTS